jgi:hypothetical protein
VGVGTEFVLKWGINFYEVGAGRLLGDIQMNGWRSIEDIDLDLGCTAGNSSISCDGVKRLNRSAAKTN